MFVVLAPGSPDRQSALGFAAAMSLTAVRSHLAERVRGPGLYKRTAAAAVLAPCFELPFGALFFNDVRFSPIRIIQDSLRPCDRSEGRSDFISACRD